MPKFIYAITDKHWGILYTIEEFKNAIESGEITDDDGFGEWSILTHHSDEDFSPSDFDVNKIPEGATHVIWYNR